MAKKTLEELAEIADKWTVKAPSTWIHKKTGNVYIVTSTGFREHDLVQLVGYQRTNGSVTFFREISEFLEKFSVAYVS